MSSLLPGTSTVTAIAPWPVITILSLVETESPLAKSRLATTPSIGLVIVASASFCLATFRLIFAVVTAALASATVVVDP